MRVAILTTDNREHDRSYSETNPRFCTAAESLLQGFAVVPDLQVHVISCSKQPMSSPERIGRNIWYHGLVVPRSGWLRTFYQGCIRAARREVAEIQPDLVHGMGTERDCSISAVFSGFPNVVTIHGNMAELARLDRARIGSYGWLTARLENFTLRRTLGVLCNSQYTEGLVRPRARKTWLVPHAAKRAFLEPLTEVRSRPCAVLVVGVISPRKRQLELLDVAEALPRRGWKCEFRFIGPAFSETDPYVAAFRNRIKPMEQTGYARYLGLQPEQRLVECFDSVAGVVHFPTEEAFGNVVVEALARGLKFFGARLGGIVDIATNVPGAELFEKGDWAGLTAAIGRWIDQGHPLAESGAQVMRQRYAPEVIAQRHLEIYQEVLKTAV